MTKDVSYLPFKESLKYPVTLSFKFDLGPEFLYAFDHIEIVLGCLYTRDFLQDEDKWRKL